MGPPIVGGAAAVATSASDHSDHQDAIALVPKSQQRVITDQSPTKAASDCSQDSPLSQTDMTALLDAHNQARADENAGLSSLRWNCDLAAVAQEWADTGSFRHSPSDWRTGRYEAWANEDVWWIGENLYWYSAPNGDPVDAVTLWVEERSLYNYQRNSCPGVCGHYTQVVWEETTDVGCGVYDRGETIVVCHYLPGGNVNGARPY